MAEEPREDVDEGPISFSGRRKRYRKPELVEWGTVSELTRGPAAGLEDFPVMVSGTQPV